MAITDVFKRAQAGELRLSRGRVVGTGPDGRVRVRFGLASAQDIPCDVLRAGAEPAVRFEPGAEVLLALADDPGKPGVILGVIGFEEMSTTSPAKAAEVSAAPTGPPEEPLVLQNRAIVIEAGEELTLKCGEASIRITRDGKIVIRGEHVLSRAKGTQRIKGGSVAIN